MVSVKLATGLDLRQASISSELSSGQRKSFACLLARSICRIGYGSAFKRDPLITMTVEQIPRYRRNHVQPHAQTTNAATANRRNSDSTRTRRYSFEPNAWSFKCRFPGAWESPVFMKPEYEISYVRNEFNFPIYII